MPGQNVELRNHVIITNHSVGSKENKDCRNVCLKNMAWYQGCITAKNCILPAATAQNDKLRFSGGKMVEGEAQGVTYYVFRCMYKNCEELFKAGVIQIGETSTNNGISILSTSFAHLYHVKSNIYSSLLFYVFPSLFHFIHFPRCSYLLHY